MSDDLKLIWFELLHTSRDLKKVRLKKYAYSVVTPSRVELHGFCDFP